MNNEHSGGFLLPLGEIEIQLGFNPRKYFDAAKHQEMIDSVLSQGVIQPIVVRPKADGTGYWLVCGERRYRAAFAAGLGEIPAIVRDLDNAQAKLIAIIENAQRDDMSPSEEAESAREILTNCGGDRDEAAKKLGWSKSKFDSRMLLLHASPNVLKALTNRVIKLGHAELLSQLTHEFQDNTLAKIMEHGYSVADLKAKLGLFAMKLADAVFDKADCERCPHNSSLHYDLFDDHISAGQCANHDCFRTKTMAAMEVKKAVLSEQYAVVYLDTERAPGSFVINCKSGKSGVGNAQFEQGCRQCGKFGALLNTAPDRLGQVTEDCCFDTTCHKGKVDDYQKSLLPQVVAAADGGKDKSASGKEGKEVKPKAVAKATKEKTPSAAVLPGKVNELVMTFYRSVASQQAVNNVHIQYCIDCYSVYRLVHQSLDKTQYPSSFGIAPASLELTFDRFMTALLPASTKDIIRFKHDLYSHLIHQHESEIHLTRTWAKASALMLRHLNVPLGQHFLLSKEFLSAFTKSGIESVLREAVNGAGQSFVAHYESLAEKNTVTGLMKKKNAELLDEVFSCGFDFTGFVPACVAAFMVDVNIKPSDDVMTIGRQETSEIYKTDDVQADSSKVSNTAHDDDEDHVDDTSAAYEDYDDEYEGHALHAKSPTGGSYDNYF